MSTQNWWGWWGAAFLLGATTCVGGGGALELKNGYLWDPLRGEPIIPRGMAYQTWNTQVDADQTFGQLAYDLREFKKLHCNSVRCEMVWSEVETNAGAFRWDRTDWLVQQAEELDIKLFVLIGFQYAPGWFPDEWRSVNENGQLSYVLNYEHPGARAAYSNYIHQVTSRYRNSTAIGAWILGNEYAYFDLWSAERYCLGYDPISLAAFRSYLANLYEGKIASLNKNWGTAYARFDEVPMPQHYPSDRHLPGYHDLIRWREQSIGRYVAAGAVAARKADPNHLLTYSMVGGIFSGDDAYYTSEDAATIVQACRDAGVPLDFWSINNYAWASYVTELRTADFGISRHRAASGLPVMVTETGHSTTEDMLPGAAERQPNALAGQMWEALMSGAIGTHIFTWNDRDIWLMRERGFGIVHRDRFPKSPGYENVVEMFRRMEALPVERLFCGSADPAPDVQMLWPEASKLVWPRANQENAMLWSALRRVGYQPGLLFDEAFRRGEYTNAPVLVLARCLQMDPADLARLTNEVVVRGIHIHADADFPGQFDTYHWNNPGWGETTRYLFGLDPDYPPAVPGWDANVWGTMYGYLYFQGSSTLGPLTAGATDMIRTWKVWHGVAAVSGQTIVTHTGALGSEGTLPALQIKTIGTAKTAATTFALADLQLPWETYPFHDWKFRYDWLRAIYRDHFGLIPTIDLSGTGTNHIFVIPDYRFGSNGSVLISLLNGGTNATPVTLTAKSLLSGLTIEDLSNGGTLESASDGALSLTLAPDEYRLLYAFTRGVGGDASLVNTNRNKLWFESAPAIVWPNEPGWTVEVGYNALSADSPQLRVQFERTSWPPRTYAASTPVAVSGKNSRSVVLAVPDADLNDLYYRSSVDGAEHVFRAQLLRSGRVVAETVLPVRLAWGVRPKSLPTTLAAGQTYDVEVEWQELPSYDPALLGLPLDRAPQWLPYTASFQSYRLTLELLGAQGQTLAAANRLVHEGSGSCALAIGVPATSFPPYRWQAYLRGTTNASPNFRDTFSTRIPGEGSDRVDPWMVFPFSEVPDTVAYLNSGVGPPGYDDQRSAFLVFTNPPTSGAYAGFGMTFTYPYRWSLPSDFSQWSNYVFSASFREESGLPCRLELQVNDDAHPFPDNGQIHFETNYVAGEGGWHRLEIPLSRFSIPDYKLTSGGFNLTKARALALNVHMLTNAVYVGFLDDIRLEGPEDTALPMVSHDVMDGFEDRDRGNQSQTPGAPLPWSSYVYPSSGAASVHLDEGVGTVATEGYQAAFLVTSNSPSTSVPAGLGFTYTFPGTWAMPTTAAARTNYSFSFAFKEENRRPCRLELQVKSGQTSWIEFGKDYTPDASGWDRVTATLDQFATPAGVGRFDPLKVQAIALNVRALEPSAIYVGFFDDVRFVTPKTFLPPDFTYARYQSSDDSAADADRDGVPDVYETGTGVFLSETNTGTSSQLADSDGDGAPDGAEIEVRTDPNVATDVLAFAQVEPLSDTEVLLVWTARTNVAYTVTVAEALPAPENGIRFVPIPVLTGLTFPADGPRTNIDPTVTAGEVRYYRLEAERQR